MNCRHERISFLLRLPTSSVRGSTQFDPLRALSTAVPFLNTLKFASSWEGNAVVCSFRIAACAYTFSDASLENGYITTSQFALVLTRWSGEISLCSPDVPGKYLFPSETIRPYVVNVLMTTSHAVFFPFGTDTDKLFPVIGFGGKLGPDQSANHSFAVNFREDRPEVEGMTGVLQVHGTLCLSQIQRIVLLGRSLRLGGRK